MVDSSSVLSAIVTALKADTNVTNLITEKDGEGNDPIYDKWEMGDPNQTPRIVVSIFSGRSDPSALNMDLDQAGTRATWEFSIVQVDVWADDQPKLNALTDQVKRCLMQDFKTSGFHLGAAVTVSLNISTPVEYRNAIRYTGFYALRSNPPAPA